MNILIVEDDQVLSLMLHKMVDEMGYHVLDIVTKGSDAIQHAVEKPCDLILMDIMLQDDIDGIEAYRQIIESKSVPVIYITGNSDSVNKERASRIGYHDFLTKPVIYNELQISISRIVS